MHIFIVIASVIVFALGLWFYVIYIRPDLKLFPKRMEDMKISFKVSQKYLECLRLGNFEPGDREFQFSLSSLKDELRKGEFKIEDLGATIEELQDFEDKLKKYQLNFDDDSDDAISGVQQSGKA
jgi:hypothetical protein